jgi:hypothetical protein
MNTHNLKIIFLDTNNKVVEDVDFLQEIQSVLQQEKTHILEWNGKQQPFTIRWDKRSLDEIDKHFVGELFARPAYHQDSIIIEHTEKTLASIHAHLHGYEIRFYISRLLGDTRMLENCAGTI